MRNLIERRGDGRKSLVRASRVREAARAAIETLETRVLMTTVTYTVQTNSDTVASIVAPSGPNAFNANTLRAAVNAANAQSFAAVIQFNAAKFTGGASNTISLTSGLTLGPVAPAGTHSYKFVGPTAKPITISGVATYTDFTVNAGISAEFDTLTIAHGNAGLNGGGINSAGPLTLTGDTFASNTASNEGGAVYNDSGLLTITNTTFISNSAADGGALAVDDVNAAAAPTITGSTFTSNVAGVEGGAVQNDAFVNSKFTVTNSTFTGNTAPDGGAISNFLTGASTTITTLVTGSSFTANTATDGVGGALFSGGTTLTITNDSFANDKASDGDGGAIDSADQTLIVSGSHFTGDSAGVSGGAIFFEGAGEVAHAIVSPTTLFTVTVTNSTFSNDTALGADDGNDFEGGGAIANLGGINSKLTVTGSTFTSDSAVGVGGAILSGDFDDTEGSGSSLTLTNDTFTGDKSTGDFGGGGAVASLDDTVAVSGSTFSNDSTGTAIVNGEISDDGGAILVLAASTFTATNSTFTNDSSILGGGIAVAAVTSTITGCTFTNDSALQGNEVQSQPTAKPRVVGPADVNGEDGGAGGGVYSESGTLTVTNSSFSHDNAAEIAGAVASADETLVVNHSTFSNNTAQAAGAIGVGAATATISNSTFTSNTATTDDGGAIYIDDDSQGACQAQLAAKPLVGPGDAELTLNVVGDTFTNNTAGGEGGAIFFNYEEDDTMDTAAKAAVAPADQFNGAELNITQSTFTTNSATFGGGAVYAETFEEEGELNIFNSTFNGNSTTFDGGGAIWDGVTDGQIANDTFVSNAAGSDVGGGGLYIHSDIDVVVTDCTFDGNSAGFKLGGGIGIGNANEPDVTLDGDIVAGNYVTGTPSTDNDLEGVFDAASTDNIIGDGSVNESSFTVGNVGGNFVGTNLKPINPMLGALANNGGPTQTQALLPGSLAIGNNADFPVSDSDGNDVTITDQRGVDRPQDQGYDIGAYQSGATPVGVTPTVSISAPATVHVPSSGTTTIQVPVTLSSTATSAIVLTYSTLGGSATSGNGDYFGVTNATTTIPAGSPAGTYFITITQVKHVTTHGAYPKTFQVKLSAATNATVVGGTETVTVTLAFP